MPLTKQQRSLIRLRGQSVLYALWDLAHGFKSWEILRPSHKSYNPSSSGVLVDEERLAFSTDMSLVSIKTGRQVYDIDLKQGTAKAKSPSVLSHFYVIVPDIRMGQETIVDIKKHSLIVSVSKLEYLEKQIANANLHNILNRYLNLEHPVRFYMISSNRVLPIMEAEGQKQNLPEIPYRALVETIGLYFLDAESIDEAELDERIQ